MALVKEFVVVFFLFSDFNWITRFSKHFLRKNTYIRLKNKNRNSKLSQRWHGFHTILAAGSLLSWIAVVFLSFGYFATRTRAILFTLKQVLQRTKTRAYLNTFGCLFVVFKKIATGLLFSFIAQIEEHHMTPSFISWFGWSCSKETCPFLKIIYNVVAAVAPLCCGCIDQLRIWVFWSRKNISILFIKFSEDLFHFV